MAGKKRKYEDDDGRTIADMSHVSAPSMFGRKPEQNEGTDGKKKNSAGVPSMPAEDRRGYVFGALSAALLIGLAFLAGLALIIVILLLIWM